MTLRTVCLTLASLCLVPVSARAQITVTAPASTVNVKAANDFATVSYHDPMDMKQNTDTGWTVWSNDVTPSGLTGVGFNQPATSGAPNSDDWFRSVSNNGAPNFYLLDASNRFSAKLGRTTDNFPINAATYRLLSFRMCLSGTGVASRKAAPVAADQPSVAYIVYSPDDPDLPGITAVGPMFTWAGCQIYTVAMDTSEKLNLGSGITQWAGTIKSLRIDPTHISGVAIDVDWVRLVDPTSGSAQQTISWTGGKADLYLDNDTNRANGNLGMLSKRNGSGDVNGTQSLAFSVGNTSGSSSYAFDIASLSPGTYYPLVCPTGVAETSSSCVYPAAGRFDVNGIPTIAVTAPSPEGSTDDFATVQLNNAWDFDSLSDIDEKSNIATLAIDSAFPMQRPDGSDLGNVRVFKGTPATSNPGDGYFYNLWFAGAGRGVGKKIDTSRYRILTVDMGIAGTRSINLGSIARVVWKTTSESAENVSQDIIINHRAGVNVLDRFTVDMKKLLLETDATAAAPAGSHGVAGWNGSVENFRLDPHEFDSVTDFYVKQIKLAALETIGSTNSYVIKWSASDPFDSGNASAATVSAFYETLTASGSPSGTRTAISTCANVAASSGQCTWNTGTVGTATYFVFLSITDGVNTNGAHSSYPIQVDPASTVKPRMVLDRALLNFGGRNANGTSVTVTPGQPVRLSIVGAGTVTWTATKAGAEPTLFSVSPTSGTGPAVLTVSVPPNTALPNNLVGNLGTVVVTSSEAENSPQSLTVYLAMTATTAIPFGGFDTPSDNSTLQGSIAVTGWALDDLGITKVQIFRDAHPSDPAGAVVNGRVFVGDATLVDGARTDIVSSFPNHPVNYNAGFGYLMLTRGLIWDSASPTAFKLYAVATDVEGNVATLGSKTVTVNNSTATKPFGSIDTPDQGGTASGNYPNTGWVLSPGTTIPAGGVRVSVDSVFLSNTFSMSDRTDITSGFPGFDTSGSGRGSFIDTTQFADGVHLIGWFVTDALGRADGIGSRFFRVSNSSLIATTAEARPAAAGSTTAFARLGERATPFGPARAVRIAEMERLELEVGGMDQHATYSAYRVVDGQLRLLPVGSTFDTRKGAFYWQPAPGFIGDYDFLFMKNGIDAAPVSVRVTVGPTTAALRAGIFRPVLTVAGRPE